MFIRRAIIYIAILQGIIACTSRQEETGFVLPEPSRMEKILNNGVLEVSTFYNTTDYYIYRGITRGFHYDLAKDFAEFLGVKLRIVEVSDNLDTAISHLREGKFDLLAMSLTHTPERSGLLSFSQPFFKTDEVLVSNKRQPLRELTELDGKEVFIPKNAQSYRKILEQLRDSLHIQMEITESDDFSYEDLLHRVETGEINYTVIDENLAIAASASMKNLDYSLKLQTALPVSWAAAPEDKLLTEELNNWLQGIRKSGKLNYLFQRYFSNQQIVPHNTTKYKLLKKGEISVFDPLLQKESKRLEWDWRLLAALVFTESRFNPEAMSEVGAYGLMQVIPETALQYKVNDYFCPDSNVYVGVRYLSYLNKYFAAMPIDSTERIKFILASYNTGAGHVLDAMRLAEKYGKDPHRWDDHVDYYLLHKNEPKYYRDSLAKNGYCHGSQPYNYVHKVLETYNNYKNIKHSQ